ncbi:MAG: hypothetical protein ABR592_09275 [Nitriliruptorales bacterium]
MTLWWLGNAVFILVIIPVVILLLHGLLKPVEEIGRYTDDILEHGVGAIAQLDAIEELATSGDQAEKVNRDLSRYSSWLSENLR